MNEEHFL